MSSSLGAFDLESMIARGGYGEVWRAHHRGSGQLVAVKVLREKRSPNPAAVAALREEVRAMAALDHPHIIQLLGLGDAGANRPAGVVQGAPWFAMELATGTLGNGVAVFDDLFCALEQVLSALAHAHARGLLHLDLKPENVLLGCVGGADEVETGRVSGLRLTDFGIARSWRSTQEHTTAQGTPAYMSPEQLRNHERRLGPWSDLYALGHVGWHLATGHRALRGTMDEVMRLQLSGTMPVFEPVFAVPERFVDWLGWCLARRPESRPQSAAEALWGLRDTLGGHRTMDTLEPTTTGGVPSCGDTTLILDDLPVVAEEARVPVVSAWTAPQVPATFHRPETWGRLRWLPDSGLDVLALRPMRVMGRDEEQAVLWKIVESVVNDRRSRVVTVTGPAGSGRHPLVSGLAEHLCETGLASILRIRHDDEGAGPALRRWSQAVGLEGDALRERLREALAGAGAAEPWRVEGLAAWLEGRRTPAPAVLASLLLGAWTRRAVLLVVETRSPDVAALVAAVVDSIDSLGVLVVWTDPGPAGASFAEHPACTTLALAPLSAHAMEGLLRAWFGLERHLADEVAAASLGLPELAAQRVHHLREIGALQSGANGLEKVGADPIDRASPDALWMARLAATADESLLQSLEAVAVDRAAWEDVDPLSLEPLLAAGLVTRDEGGWGLGGAREAAALQARALAGGRLPELHQRAAQRATEPHLRGVHLLAAGDGAAAADAFLASTALRHRQGAYRGSSQSAEQAAMALAAAAVPADDPRWGTQRLAELEACAGRGLIAEVRALVPALVRDATRCGWPVALARATELRGWLSHNEHRNDDGQVDAAEAARQWEALGRVAEQGRALTFEGLYRLAMGDASSALERLDTVFPLLEGHDAGRSTMVTARVARANALQRLGRVAESETELMRAYDVAEGDDTARGRVCRQLVVTLVQANRPHEALRFVEESARLCRQSGALVGLSHTLNLKGEVLRELGRLEEASKTYLEAIDLSERQGADTLHVSLNLAQTLLHMGENDAALARAESLEPGDQKLEAMLQRLVVLVAHARCGRWMSARGLAQTLVEDHRALAVQDRDLMALVELGLQATATGDTTVRAALQAVCDYSGTGTGGTGGAPNTT